MRVVVAALAWVLSLCCFLLGGLTFYMADRAFDESSRWLAAAVWRAECAPGKPSAGMSECVAMAQRAPVIEGVAVTDQSLLQSFSSTSHATATGLLTICGLSVSTASFFFAIAAFLSSRRPKDVVRERQAAEPG